MNHKRGKPKNSRAGCLMCKPHKANGQKHVQKHSVMKRELTFPDHPVIPRRDAEFN